MGVASTNRTVIPHRGPGINSGDTIVNSIETIADAKEWWT